MGGGSSAGPAPQFDASGVASGQVANNFQTGIGNAYLANTNQITPFGTLNYAPTGNTNIGGVNVPTFTATETLSPAEQSLFTQLQGLQSQQYGVQGQQLNVAGQALNGAQTDIGMLQSALQGQGGAENQAYSELMGRQNQQFGTETSQLQTQLANEGIAPGTTAYNNAFLPLNQSQVDATNQAQLAATQLAGQNIQNIASPLSTLTGIGAQQPSLPSAIQLPSSTYAASTPANIQTADVTSPYVAQYQGQLAAYNQQLAANNATTGGLFGLGGSALSTAGIMGMMAYLAPAAAAA